METELALNQPWSMGEGAFEAICKDARELSPKIIVEFGSGPSSIRLAQAFPEARILSIDDSPKFGGATRKLAAKHGLSDRVEVSVRSLKWQWHSGALYESYTPGPFPEPIDFIVVDGPPGATRRGREVTVRQALPNIRIGGRIYVDDHRRPAERRIVRNWRSAYPGAFKTWILPCKHEICVLEKVTVTSAPLVRTRVVVDVWLANLRRGAGWIKRQILPGSSELPR